uniref:CD300C molecule 2 n=1 Tax=Mus musculus TaxID=10090 RepID=E0CYN3_MOUSE
MIPRVIRLWLPSALFLSQVPETRGFLRTDQREDLLPSSCQGAELKLLFSRLCPTAWPQHYHRRCWGIAQCVMSIRGEIQD